MAPLSGHGNNIATDDAKLKDPPSPSSPSYSSVTKSAEMTNSSIVADYVMSKKLKWFSVKHIKQARYIYVDDNRYGIVWGNVVMFAVLHIYFFYGLYVIMTEVPIYTWLFDFALGLIGGIGVTCGAHRLWSHRCYKAGMPLRILLCTFHTMAGQNDMVTWVRDHRLHHKFSETDADPHNSRRGMFFAHVGWLLTKKHPDVMIKGKTIDCSDLLADPVLTFQRKYYLVAYLLLRFALPMLVPIYGWNESLSTAFIGVFAQYICSLHCTWFVNSAAHMLGDRPYNDKIQPRNNDWVNFAAYGEGHHNYHHTFPWDYTISENGWKFNPMKYFIELMAVFGLAHSLKRASPEMIAQRKAKIAKRILDEANQNECSLNASDDAHPYVQPAEY